MHLIQDGIKKLIVSSRKRWGRLARSPQALDGANASPERAQTDQGLQMERGRADQALVRQAAVQDDADLVVDRAREDADAVLSVGRERADAVQPVDPASPPIPPATLLAEQRTLEDQALQKERDSTDERVRRERDETAHVLTRILPLEREATDRYLLTERIRSDDALANRDDFLGIVAHDVRDLLSGVVLSAKLLSTSPSESEEGKRARAEAERIQRYAARMNRLIGDLVDVASIDAGKLAMARTPGDAALLIAEAVDTFHAAALAKDISLKMEIVERPLSAAFDHDRMLQVLANVISNSIKFTPVGGRISVQSERAGNEVRFTISDTGPGIPDDSLEVIFERFWQVGKNDRRGLGLGLYLSRCIVEAHGGKIWAESRLGEGSRLCFTLPA